MFLTCWSRSRLVGGSKQLAMAAMVLPAVLGACWAQQVDAAAAAAAVQRRTMVYMYCGPDPNQGNHSGDAACDERTSVALSHSSSISTLVLGSYLCRLPEYDDESGASWCNYQANYSTHIAQLSHAGIEVLLNAAGAHNFERLPAVVGSGCVERMVELALALNASGWAFDLEAKGIPLSAYLEFFAKVRRAFAPHGLQLQYTAGHHFANSLNFSALLPLVDWVFDMSEYSHPERAFPTRYSTVPPGMGHKYVPGASVNQWKQEDTGPALATFERATANGVLQTIGLFTINENLADWWWNYLDAWIASSRGSAASIQID